MASICSFAAQEGTGDDYAAASMAVGYARRVRVSVSGCQSLATEAVQGPCRFSGSEKASQRAGRGSVYACLERWIYSTYGVCVSCIGVYVYEHMVQQSGIKQMLQQQRQDPIGTKGIESELGYQLGYFALILQLRLHVQVGLFYSGVAAVEDIELSTKAFYWRVPAAHASFLFHLGFAYMMLRRYQDAIRVMSQALLSLSRQRGQLASASSLLNSSVSRASDRMHVLLLLCTKLSGTKLDDSIHQAIKERYSDKFYKLQQETEEAYCELFTWAAPRFIDPAAPPTYDDEAFEKFVSGRAEIRLRVCKLFLKDVESRRKVNTINSFTKLYHNIPLAKLGRLMDENAEEPESRVRADLMTAKLRSHQRVWKNGSLLSGDLQQPHVEGAVDFKIEGDMVHNQQTQRVFVDYFVKQIERTESLISAVQHAVIAPAPQLQTMQQQQQDSPSGNRDRRKPQAAF
ncbi:eukaryotic translation initiation factor 3 subunit L [Cyclospora cayetanensis]|uniref:Eukaryotic translation initiation factor 3 subunit L n=1 Tax=Cyclospora cayetanensis TaxID=88456 RepID=A0A6P6S5D6_9EIME|nr:eukaryotic translation initiation factor 3 subunit L [Cyclospora cayetanensis]